MLSFILYGINRISLRENEMNEELSREELYLVLIKNFHDDVWHCSRTEDGLVEIQFYVKED